MELTKMKHYSPVAPIALLERLQSIDLLGDYLLVLAHDVLENEDRYRTLCSKVPWSGGLAHGFIILDNSVVELGESMSAQKLVQAAGIVGADCIVLPDVMEDATKTIEASREAMLELSHLSYGFMKIVQGKTMSDFPECITWMCNHIPGHYWAVPRWITNIFGSRMFIIHQILDHDPDAKIHLLGMSTELDDDIKCTKHPSVMGIDSANPLVLGQKGFILNGQHVARGKYWSDLALSMQTIYNIKCVRRLINE